VKENQASLREEIQTVFDIEQGKSALKMLANDVEVASSVEKGHGRIEERKLSVSSVLRGHLMPSGNGYNSGATGNKSVKLKEQTTTTFCCNVRQTT
jgi:hypothetical protein